MQRKLIGYKFSRFFLDLRTRTLTCEGETLELSERAFQLLVLLAEASPNSLDKQTLTDSLWGETVVSDWSLSRLISDTRQILGDAGDRQQLIKTARGIGFSLTGVEAQYEKNVELSDIQPIPLTKPNWLLRTIASLLMLAVLWLAHTFYTQYQHQQLVAAVERIKGYQDNTFTTFMAQVGRRNELVEMIESRLGIEREDQFEKFFARYFSQLNEQERFVFDQIRAMTETGLYQNNKGILEELNANPALFDQIEGTHMLQQHLAFWLNKYQSVFLKREDMCLLYVGVEDGLPYPSGVDQRVIDWLALQAKQAKAE